MGFRRLQILTDERQTPHRISCSKITKKLLLTFDIEDFINPNVPNALLSVLEMLEKNRLRAIFFITGHMAEKLSNFPAILEKLCDHEIGFHSSAHSVRPIIGEYTDLRSYQAAHSVSLERETAHINPLTGRVEGEGGILFLQDLFKPKRIRCFRAPGMSWTPPHLEALAELGVKYDFSSSITTSEPARYKGLTFYPYTFTQEWEGSLYDYQCLIYALLRLKVAILSLHPTLYVNQDMWDCIYYKGNPSKLLMSRKKPLKEANLLFARFEKMLKRISMLRNLGLLEVDPVLIPSSNDLIIDQNQIQMCYETSMRWTRRFFNYNPRSISSHFQEFFHEAMLV